MFCTRCFYKMMAMLIKEIPKTDNIIIGFNLAGRHFSFSTSFITIRGEEYVCALPIEINENELHLDSRCENVTIEYLNQLSGRTHIWRNVDIEYDSKGFYRIRTEEESSVKNRRRAIRVPIGIRTQCKISDLEGTYPCTISDVSVTGIGINIDVALAERKLTHRLIYTQFTDHTLNKSFVIKGRCLHTTTLDNKNARCDCEITSSTPSINEYISQLPRT